MSSVRICDQRDCPAPALHDIILYGQDFHFCGHHWAELQPVLLSQASSRQADRAPEPPERRRHGPLESLAGRS